MRKPARELCVTHPGVFGRRQAIILALCHGTDMAKIGEMGATVVGCRIIDCANKIIEETEQ